VACNASHTIEARCSRWLLSLQDRLGSEPRSQHRAGNLHHRTAERRQQSLADHTADGALMADRSGNLMTRYSDCLLAQVLQSVACNASHTIEARCSRWLHLDQALFLECSQRAREIGALHP
jgi:hypothetical protein